MTEFTIISRVIAIFAAILVSFAAPAFAAKLTEKQAVKKAQAAIAQGHWTRVPTECLSFEPVAPEWSFVVREEHHKRCGGDALMSPRLFELRVNPQTGVVQKVE